MLLFTPDTLGSRSGWCPSLIPRDSGDPQSARSTSQILMLNDVGRLRPLQEDPGILAPKGPLRWAHLQNKIWFRLWCSVIHTQTPARRAFHLHIKRHGTPVEGAGLWRVGVVGPSLLLPSPAIMMNRFLKNKRKKSPETSLQNTFSETPANIAAGPVTHLNISSQGGRESGSEGRSS